MQGKRALKTVAIIIIALFMTLVLYFFIYPTARVSYLEHRADTVVEELERYRRDQGHYPAGLGDIGRAEEAWLIYESRSDRFTLGFHTGYYWYLNHYDSETGAWHIRD